MPVARAPTRQVASHPFPLTSADAVMAFAIAGVGALPMLPGVGRVALAGYASAVLLLWLLSLVRLLRAALRGDVRRAMQPTLARFGLGTWVAATAATGMLLLQVWPGARLEGQALLFIAAGFWVVLLVAAARAIPALLRQHEHRGPGGAGLVLLFAVATQSLALLACALGDLSWVVRYVLPAIGLSSYGAGLMFMLMAHEQRHDWKLARHAATTNCIVHGALAISGLALISAGLGDSTLWRGLWLLVASGFVVIEGAELQRLAQRIARYGWVGALLQYRVSQWVRNFTFGMLLAYTLALRQHDPAPWLLAPLLTWVAHVGPWLVMALLVLECALWLVHWALPSLMRDAAAKPTRR